VAHNSATVTSLASGSLTTTNANDIILYGVNTPTATSAWTPGTGFTFPTGSTQARSNMDYEIVSPTQSGLTTTSWTNSSKCIGIIAAFKQAGASTGPAVSLSTTSLTFASQQVGTSSAAQSVTLTNSGGASLNITSIVPSGDYSQSNTCGSAVAAGANCSISVTFTPTATGTRTGTITITDSASDSPQTVSLTGTGATAGGSLSVVKAAAAQNTASSGITSLSVPVSTSANNLLVAFVAEGGNNTDTMLVSDSTGTN